MQLVGKVLSGKKKKKIRVMLLMQFQTSLGMCLQDSNTETGPGTSCTLRWKRSREREKKIKKEKKIWRAERKKDPGEHLVYPSHFTSVETEAPTRARGWLSVTESRGELGAEPMATRSS